MGDQSSNVRQSSSPSSRTIIDRLLAEPADIYPGAEYLPIVALILPVIGSSLHGSVADWQRLLLLGFTLHHLVQFMRCPSGLVRASLVPSFSSTSFLPTTAKAAILELRIINLLATIVLLASPFLALGFLHLLQSTMGPEESLIDQFATRVCFIAVALRPCAYLMSLFQPHRPPASKFSTVAEDLKVRIQNLSKALIVRADVTAILSELNDLDNQIKAPIDGLGRTLNNLTRRRQSALPATIQAQKILAQTTVDIALRTQTIEDSVNEHASLLARRQSSAPAVLRARTNEFITATGITLQRLGMTLAPHTRPS